MILARWLMGITVAIADRHPDDRHAQFFGHIGLHILFGWLVCMLHAGTALYIGTVH